MHIVLPDMVCRDVPEPSEGGCNILNSTRAYQSKENDALTSNSGTGVNARAQDQQAQRCSKSKPGVFGELRDPRGCAQLAEVQIDVLEDLTCSDWPVPYLLIKSVTLL